MKFGKLPALTLLLASVFASGASAQKDKTNNPSKTAITKKSSVTNNKTVRRAGLGVLPVVVITGQGNTASYNSLADAFVAINNGVHTGTISINIVGDTSEPVTGAFLNASGTASANYASIRITPSGTRVIEFDPNELPPAGVPLIDLRGADNVTIDGLNTNGNSLTINNSNTSANQNTSAIRFIDGATNNTITNSTILSSVSGGTSIKQATIYFANDSKTANGNDNNTISYNNIGASASGTTSQAISSWGTTGIDTAKFNSGINIIGNNIYDYFLPTRASAGILLGEGNSNWTISNNKLYQTAARSSNGTTNPLTHSGIQLNSADIRDCVISGNTIGYSNSNAAGVYTLTGGNTFKFYPIYIQNHNAAALSSITDNTITAIKMTGTFYGAGNASPFAAIQYSVIVTSSSTPNISGNKIGSQSTPDSIKFVTDTSNITDSNSATYVYGINFLPTSSVNISNNQISGIDVENRAASKITGLMGINISTSPNNKNNVTNNVVGSADAPVKLTVSDSAAVSLIRGIFIANGNVNAVRNVVRNITTNSPNIGKGGSASVVGIYLTPNSNDTLSKVSNNFVSNISNTNATANVSALGLYFNGTMSGSLVERNNIQTISASGTGTGAVVSGLYADSTGTNYQNNMISLGANMTANSPQINGIFDAAGVNLYHNSVSIGGSGVSAGSGTSSALRSEANNTTRKYLNNSFYNARSNGAATGTNYAVYMSGTGANPTGLTSNYNDLYVKGTSGVIGWYNNANQTKLNNWQTATGQDLNSLSLDPLYYSAVNLHLQSNSPLINAAPAINGVTNDYDNEARPNALAFASFANNFDIGADEYNRATAASVELSGRVTTAAGNGIRNVSVYVTDANGNTQMTTTGTFGIYRFENLPLSQTCIVTVSAKRHTFSNPMRVIELTESVTNADFVADNQEN